MTNMKPGSVLKAAEMLWPEFLAQDDTVFLLRERSKISQPLDSLGPPLEQECFVNHVHVLDECENDAKLTVEPFWNNSSTDFLNAIQLALEFPTNDFAIFAIRDDNPIVRFHKIRSGDAFWADPATLEHDFPDAALFIHVEKGRILRRIGRLKPNGLTPR
jgi:hypothetical protein